MDWFGMGWKGWKGSTFGDVGHFVLAHGFERLALQFALHFGRDTNEVDGYCGEGEDAREDGEECCCCHGDGIQGRFVQGK